MSLALDTTEHPNCPPFPTSHLCHSPHVGEHPCSIHVTPTRIPSRMSTGLPHCLLSQTKFSQLSLALNYNARGSFTSSPVYTFCGLIRSPFPGHLIPQLPTSTSIPLWTHPTSRSVKEAILSQHTPWKYRQQTEILEQNTHPKNTNPEIST